jgi:hypothetical protein
VAATILLIAAITAPDVDRLLKGHRRRTVDASTIELLDAITDRAAEVQSTVLLGTWNHLSPWLVEWSCLQRGSSMDPDQVPREPTGRARRRNLVEWLAADPPELLMVVSASPRSRPRAGFIAETGWLEPVRKRLLRDARFDLVFQEDFPPTFYRLQAFKAARTGAQPVPR